MKSEQRISRHAFVILLLCISTTLILSSCSKKPSKMEGQSATWKLTDVSVKRLPKKPDVDRRNYPSANSQADLLEVAFTAELLGAGGKIAIPNAVLLDGKGQKHESVQLSRGLPEQISNMPEGHPKDEDIQRFMMCLSPELEGREPCPIATGEKLSLSSSFVDPKDYAGLKFSFADVPPIALKAPEN